MNTEELAELAKPILRQLEEVDMELRAVRRKRKLDPDVRAQVERASGIIFACYFNLCLEVVKSVGEPDAAQTDLTPLPVP